MKSLATISYPSAEGVHNERLPPFPEPALSGMSDHIRSGREIGRKCLPNWNVDSAAKAESEDTSNDLACVSPIFGGGYGEELDVFGLGSGAACRHEQYKGDDWSSSV